MTLIRTLIVVVASRGWLLYQMDVKNAFLHGDLHEEIYVKPPLGLPNDTSHVRWLCKALYGLKQAPRAWFQKFCIVIIDFGFIQSHHDSALFVRKLIQALLFYCYMSMIWLLLEMTLMVLLKVSFNLVKLLI